MLWALGHQPQPRERATRGNMNERETLGRSPPISPNGGGAITPRAAPRTLRGAEGDTPATPALFWLKTWVARTGFTKQPGPRGPCWLGGVWGLAHMLRSMRLGNFSALPYLRQSLKCTWLGCAGGHLQRMGPESGRPAERKNLSWGGLVRVVCHCQPTH